MFAGVYRRSRVFVTGHTGFKGSWLCEWLLMLGADVTGFSDRVEQGPTHFAALELDRRITHITGDVRDGEGLRRALASAEPDFVFHLAARPLVRYSYDEPIDTVATNVLGTAHLLDALRTSTQPIQCVVVTSDKCYDNREVLAAYREDDPLGGHDPYSASKGAAEIIAHSFRRSFFSGAQSPVRMATARAGNVIGGGDWSVDRIVPDCIRSLLAGEPIRVRSPLATRPWQHVLESLSGYLWLGALLTGRIRLAHAPNAASVCEAYNFGPWVEGNRSVEALVSELLTHWDGAWVRHPDASQRHEAGLLNLAIDRAYHKLEWRPTLTFEQCVSMTANWYRKVASERTPAQPVTRADIESFYTVARERGIRWALDSSSGAVEPSAPETVNTRARAVLG
jgi:CDP-glucose 4,6-dehydratase